MYTSGCLNTWCSDNQSMKYCAVLGAQGIRATGFKGAQGNAHCTKFESNTNRMTFETNAISTTSDIQAHHLLQSYNISQYRIGIWSIKV